MLFARRESDFNSLENISIKLFKWFPNNQLKANKVKGHLLVSDNITINVDGNITGKSICEKLLGVNVDKLKQYKLKHLDSILKKEGRKVNALSRILPLARILPYMNFEKKTRVNKLVFYVTVQLLPFSIDVSQPYNE